MFEIEKGIPIPDGDGRGREKSPLRLTVEKMEVGDSVVVSNTHRQQLHAISNKLGIKYKPEQFAKKAKRFVFGAQNNIGGAMPHFLAKEKTCII